MSTVSITLHFLENILDRYITTKAFTVMIRHKLESTRNI